MCHRPRSTFGCIFCTICILVAMLFFSIIIFLITDSPSDVEFHVTDASLTQFNLTSNNTLHYNFKLNITARNPNNNVIVHYRQIKATAWYKDKDFGWVNLAPFDQGHKNTTFLEAVFEGQTVIKLKPRQLGEYEEETSVGVYNDLAVDLDLSIRAKHKRLGGSDNFNPPIIQCRRSMVPLNSNSNSNSNSKTTSPSSVTKCECETGSFFEDRNHPPEAGAAGTEPPQIIDQGKL